MLREQTTRRRLTVGLCGLTLALLFAASMQHEASVEAAPGMAIAPRRPEPAERSKVVITLDHVHRRREGYVADLAGDAHAELTLDPRLQALAEKIITNHHAPYGAAVLLSVDDGRVLAMAGRSEAEPQKSSAELCLTPWAPAASVFKIVTASALVEKGVKPGTEVCYHDGIHSVEASNLTSHPRLDRACNSLAYGIAKSQNAILARLASDHLDGPTLTRVAHLLGFGERLPFEVPVTPSLVDLPAGGLPFARSAAGFWQSTLSPLHGAWLAATIGRGGTTPPLHIVERIVRGRETTVEKAPEARRVLPERVARAVAAMMVGTTRFGTARLSFHDGRGRTSLPIDVAGKTGSLNRKEGPFLAYSWFVGFAPALHPEVAVAVLLGNGSGRDARAHKLARELLEGYFRRESPSKLMIAAR